MAADLEIDITDRVTPSIVSFLDTISPSGMTELNRLGSRAALTAMQGYHRAFDSRGGWFNKALPTWQSTGLPRASARKRTQWPKDVIRAWSIQGLNPGGFRLNNSHPHFKHKVEGGTISSGKVLTIPLVPAAHGRTTRQFERVTGYKLFRPKGKNVLMARSLRGEAFAVYALVKSVTHKPWPGALPIEERYVGPCFKAMVTKIREALEEE